MEATLLKLFIAVATPMIMLLFVFKGRHKTIMAFLLIGLYICLLAGVMNSIILSFGSFNRYYISINVAPAVEEILKALPILVFAFIWKPNRQLLLECSLAVGVGFAVLENAYFMANTAELTLWFSIVRGFGAGMMHGICTLCVGYGMTFIHTKRKLFYTGSIAILVAAIVFHSIYNVVIQSAYSLAGVILPTICFLTLIFSIKRNGIKIGDRGN